jgi:protein-disulfide isomerase
MSSTPKTHVLTLLALAMLALTACAKSSAGVAGPDDMSMGDPNAKVKVVEYASLTCPHCARFANDVFPAFKAKYVDTGKVQYTYKEFFTPPADVAAAGYVIARCAGKDKYFAVLEGVFRSQQEMFTKGNTPRAVLLRVAQSTGMTEAQFKACLADEKAGEALKARVEKSARADKIQSTPTFFVNGKMVKEGEITLKELDAAIAAASK